MFNRKGQNIAEYSILIALVIAAAVAMQVYVKRGIQGKVKDAVVHAPNLQIRDDTDGTFSVDVNFKTPQYEPYYLESKGEVESERGLTENITANGKIDRGDISENTTRLQDAFDRTRASNNSDR